MKIYASFISAHVVSPKVPSGMFLSFPEGFPKCIEHIGGILTQKRLCGCLLFRFTVVCKKVTPDFHLIYRKNGGNLVAK